MGSVVVVWGGLVVGGDVVGGSSVVGGCVVGGCVVGGAPTWVGAGAGRVVSDVAGALGGTDGAAVTGAAKRTLTCRWGEAAVAEATAPASVAAVLGGVCGTVVPVVAGATGGVVVVVATVAAATPVRIVRVGLANPYKPATDPIRSAPERVAAAAPLAITSARLSTMKLPSRGRT